MILLFVIITNFGNCYEMSSYVFELTYFRNIVKLTRLRQNNDKCLDKYMSDQHDFYGWGSLIVS